MAKRDEWRRASATERFLAVVFVLFELGGLTLIFVGVLRDWETGWTDPGTWLVVGLLLAPLMWFGRIEHLVK